MRMRTLLAPTLVTVLTVLTVPLGSASVAEAPAAAGYTAYVACGHKKSAKPSHECRKSQAKAAFFVSEERDATYKVCVKYPGRPGRLCANAQQAPQDKLQRNTITTERTGRHKVTWYVDGAKVAAWTFHVVAR